MIQRNIAVLVFAFMAVLAPFSASALQMKDVVSESRDALGITAQSYVVLDKATGTVLLEKNSSAYWIPASLTKLVTVMVVLDTKPKMDAIVTMQKADEVGGARLATKAGVSYRFRDLLYATLVASANNAANALARSTGLSREEFVARMNQKAADLGAKNTYFVEPTGIDERSISTAADYVLIARAAFGNSVIATAASTKDYAFTSTNNKRYKHTLTSTNKLLGDPDLEFMGAKTGYLVESRNNFVTELKDRFANDFIIILMGSQNSSTQFKEVRQLALFGALYKAFNFFGSPGVSAAGSFSMQ